MGNPDRTRAGAIVAGAAMAIGSCLRWLTVTSALTGPMAIDTSSGLHDLGYATGGPIALGDLSLLFGSVTLVIALASRRDRPSRGRLVVVALASAGALVVSVSAALLILHHESTRPVGANVDFHTSVGIWLTLGGAVVGLASAAIGIAKSKRVAVPMS